MKRIITVGIALLMTFNTAFAGSISVWQVTERISVTSSGAEVTGGDSFTYTSRSLSADARYVVYASAATNLVSGDTNGVQDVFVRDRTLGTTTRISTSSSGDQAVGGHSNTPSIARNGRYVVFQSLATNLVTNVSGTQIYLKDMLSGTTEVISVSSTGVVGNAASSNATVSADGRYVLFASSANNLVTGDTNTVTDIFLRDRTLGTTTLVSKTQSGGLQNSNSSLSSMSEDARYAYFSSNATNILSGVTTTNGNNIFLRDTLSGTTNIVGLTSTGVRPNSNSFSPRATPDGLYIVGLLDATNIGPGNDTNGVRDGIFVSYFSGNVATRVTQTQSGIQGNATVGNLDITPSLNYIVFNSAASNYISGDTNGQTDIYMKNFVSGDIQRVSVGIFGQEGNGTSTLPSLSDDGRTVVFYSNSTNLISGDTNGLYDVFLAQYVNIPLDPPTILSPISGSISTVGSVAIAGTGYAGYKIILYNTVTSGVLRSGLVSSTGYWNASLPTLTGSTYSIMATQTYLSGNYSSGAAYTSFSTNLPAPTVSTYTSGNTLLNTGYLLFTGTAVPRSMIYVNISGNIYASTTNSSGAWSLPVYGIPDGVYSGITATQSIYGAVSSGSIPMSWTIDTLAPAGGISMPTSGTLYTVYTSQVVTLAGTGEIGALYTISSMSGFFSSGYVDNAGNWSVDLGILYPGSYQYNVRFADIAGNVSDTGSTQFAIFAPELGAPVIVNPVTGSSYIVGDVQVYGVGLAGYQLDLFNELTNDFLWSGIISNTGSWATTLLALPANTYTLRAKQTYAGAFTSGYAYTSFSTYLSAPSITSLSSGWIQNTGAITILGSGTIGATIQLYVSGTVYPSIVDGSGNWSVDLVLADGNYEIFATQNMVATTSSPSSTISVIIDTQAPSGSIVAPIENKVFFSPLTTGIVLSGTAEANTEFIIYYNGDVVTTGFVSSSGNWIYNLGILAVNSYEYSVQFVDSAMNTSSLQVVRFSVQQATVSVGGGGGGGSWIASPRVVATPTTIVTVPNVVVPTVPLYVLPPKGDLPLLGASLGGPGEGAAGEKVFNSDFDANPCFVRRTADLIDQGISLSSEQQKAQKLLFAYGLTKYAGTKDFMPFDEMTREQAAKLFSEFAKNVLCRTPYLEYKNSFLDVATADPTLQASIIDSYKYGIFKGGKDRLFRPKDTLSRDEIMAITVRLLTGKIYPENGLDWAAVYRKMSSDLKCVLLSVRRIDIATYLYQMYSLHFDRTDGGYILKLAEK